MPKNIGTIYLNQLFGGCQHEPSGSARTSARPAKPESCHTGGWYHNGFAGGSVRSAWPVRPACQRGGRSSAWSAPFSQAMAAATNRLAVAALRKAPGVAHHQCHRNRHRGFGLGGGLYRQLPARGGARKQRSASGWASQWGVPGIHNSAPSSINASLGPGVLGHLVQHAGVNSRLVAGAITSASSLYSRAKHPAARCRPHGKVPGCQRQYWQ